MDKFLSVLSKEEVISLSLRALYSNFGYKKYRMSKFEEYDLYVRNKDFLISERVITFNDTDGRLLALKPDVTLSIVKNVKSSDTLQKVYYDENVYRVVKGGEGFKEIMQSGLECIGSVDSDTVCEVLFLAGKSLETISKNNVLVISNLDIISGVIDYVNLSSATRKEVIKLLGEKNVFAIKELAEKDGVSTENCKLLQKLVSVCGKPSSVLENLSVFEVNAQTKEAVNALKVCVNSLLSRGISEENITIDFSVVNDMKYYNGIAFKGYVEGIPTGILSGGEYDKLMKMMGKNSKAIGFAVYLDDISRIYED